MWGHRGNGVNKVNWQRGSCEGQNGNSRQLSDLRITSNEAKAHDPTFTRGFCFQGILTCKGFSWNEIAHFAQEAGATLGM